jgi:hypothetical protein
MGQFRQLLHLTRSQLRLALVSDHPPRIYLDFHRHQIINTPMKNLPQDHQSSR